MKNTILLVLTLLVTSSGYSSKNSIVLERPDFLGTTWAMHLKGDSYDYFWLSCDSTFIDYDEEIENYYYGRFAIKYDTLILNQQYQDDYHQYGAFPIKVKSLSVEKFLIVNDSTLVFLSSDHVKASPDLIYKLKQRFNCNSLNNQ